MCVGRTSAPAPTAPAEKPVFIRNPYLDEKENKQGIASRTDRASLVVPLETGIGFEGRGGTGAGTDGGTARGNFTGIKARSAGSLTISPSPALSPRVPGQEPGYGLPPGNRYPGGSAGRTDGAVPVRDPRDPRIRR